MNDFDDTFARLMDSPVSKAQDGSNYYMLIGILAPNDSVKIVICPLFRKDVKAEEITLQSKDYHSKKSEPFPETGIR